MAGRQRLTQQERARGESARPRAGVLETWQLVCQNLKCVWMLSAPTEAPRRGRKLQPPQLKSLSKIELFAPESEAVFIAAAGESLRQRTLALVSPFS